MKTKTHCRGYLKMNNYKSYYDISFNYIVEATFNYVDVTTQTCYDVNGIELGEYKSEKHYSKHEVKDISESCKHKLLIQIDFDFKIIPCMDGLNADEIQEFIKTLNRSNVGKYYEGWCIDFRDFKQNENKDEAELIEIASFGKTRTVYKNLGKSFFNVNLNEYKKNFEKFCEENADWRHSAKSIYDTNIKNLCNYFLCTEKQLFKNDLSTFMIRRLQRNINTKEVEIIKKKKRYAY